MFLTGELSVPVCNFVLDIRENKRIKEEQRDGEALRGDARVEKKRENMQILYSEQYLNLRCNDSDTGLAVRLV